MRNSEHFNLFLAEGSDIVNPLVQDVENYEKIDEQMFKNQNAGVQNATELKNGTVHAITRNVPDAQFITFTATSNYTAGETFTVDGIQVSALTVSGETLPTGAYVINSQVLCILKGTLLTVYCVGSKVADNSLALNGHPDTYFGTKEEVDNAIDTANAANVLVNEINNKINKNFEVLKKVTSPQTITLDITGHREFLMGRANDANVLNDIITFDKGMLTACDIEIANSGVVVAKATLNGNILTVNLTTIVSGYFYLFGK